MIPSVLKGPLFGSATVATVTSLLPTINPEAFRSTAVLWIAAGSAVFAALVGALSLAIPLWFGLVAKFDKAVAERAARRGVLPKVVVTVDVPPTEQTKEPEPAVRG